MKTPRAENGKDAFQSKIKNKKHFHLKILNSFFGKWQARLTCIRIFQVLIELHTDRIKENTCKTYTKRAFIFTSSTGRLSVDPTDRLTLELDCLAHPGDISALTGESKTNCHDCHGHSLSILCGLSRNHYDRSGPENCRLMRTHGQPFSW